MTRRNESGDKLRREVRRLAVSLVFIVLTLGLWQSGIVDDYLRGMFVDAMYTALP